MGLMLSSLQTNSSQQYLVDLTNINGQEAWSVEDWRYLGWGATLTTIALFQVIHGIFHKLQTKTVSFTGYDYWKWKNLWISWFHALVCGSWVVLNVIWYPEFITDLILHITYSSYLMVCFSVGYFIYDYVDMWRNNLLHKHWELTIHHIAITSIMIWNLYDCQRIGWNIIALSAEINSFFLHSRKLMQLHDIDTKSKLYIINMLMNFISFILLRFGSCFCIFFGLIYHYHRVPLFYYYALVSCQFVMNVINPILFMRLLKSDLNRLRKDYCISGQNTKEFCRVSRAKQD